MVRNITEWKKSYSIETWTTFVSPLPWALYRMAKTHPNPCSLCFRIREVLLCFSKHAGLSQLPSEAHMKSSLGSGHLNPFSCFDNAFLNKESQLLGRKTKIRPHPRSWRGIPSGTEIDEILVGAITMTRRRILVISYKLVCSLSVSF